MREFIQWASFGVLFFIAGIWWGMWIELRRHQRLADLPRRIAKFEEEIQMLKAKLEKRK